MVTVVNNPAASERIVEVDKGDSGAGWAVAVVVLLIVIAGGAYFWMHRAAAQPASGGTNINVTLPAGTGNTQNTPTQ